MSRTTALPVQTDIDDRLARYFATLDAAVLWPEITAHAFRAAQEEIARVTAAVLAHAAAPVPFAPPPGLDSRVVGVAAFTAGMGPLLGFWCESGRIAAEPTLEALFATHLDHGRQRAARMRSQVERLALAFADRALEVTVLKGMHTASAYFPDPGTRPMADVDLLVRPEDLERARATLLAGGYVEYEENAPPRRHHWWPPGVSRRPRSLELCSADDPWSLDLHASLDIEFFPGLTAGFGCPQPSQLGRWNGSARGMHVLTGPLLLGYLAFHASSHFFTTPLVRLVELVLVARRDFAGGSEAWQAFDDVITPGRSRFVYPSLELAERLVPGTIDPGVRNRLSAATPGRLRRIVARTTPGGVQRIHAQPHGERYLWIASPRELLAAALAFLWPRGRTGATSLSDILEIQARRIVRVGGGFLRRLMSVADQGRRRR